MNTVYSLIDPRTSEPKYVGLTRMPLRLRLAQHMSHSASIPVKAWVNELDDEGLKPDVMVLEYDVPNEKANETETFWIQYVRFLGASLLNVRRNSQPRKCQPEQVGITRSINLGDTHDALLVQLSNQTGRSLTETLRRALDLMKSERDKETNRSAT